jgi:hypothetical protein
MNVGDKVMIRENSQFYGAHHLMNPAGVVGTVIYYSGGTHQGVHVEWFEGYSNTYDESDLIIMWTDKPKKSFGKLDNFTFG